MLRLAVLLLVLALSAPVLGQDAPRKPAPGRLDFGGVQFDAPLAAPAGNKLDLEVGRLDTRPMPPTRRNSAPACSEETARAIDLGRGIEQAMPLACRPGLRVGRGKITVRPGGR